MYLYLKNLNPRLLLKIYWCHASFNSKTTYDIIAWWRACDCKMLELLNFQKFHPIPNTKNRGYAYFPNSFETQVVSSYQKKCYFAPCSKWVTFLLKKPIINVPFYPKTHVIYKLILKIDNFVTFKHSVGAKLKIILIFLLNDKMVQLKDF